MEEELEKVPEKERNAFKRLVEKIVRTIEDNPDNEDTEESQQTG